MSRVLAALQRHALEKPQQTALTGSQASLNHGQLLRDIEQAARALEGSRVLATLLPNSPAWVVADLAALHAGLVHVPLPPFFTDAQLQHALHDAGVDTVITDQPARINSLAPVSKTDLLDMAGLSCHRLLLRPQVRNTHFPGTAKITYTSGTTGTPRGVCLSQAGIEAVTVSLAEAAGGRADDRAMVLLPLSILLENIGSVYAPILCGAEVIVPDPGASGVTGSNRVDAARLAHTLDRYRPSTLIVPPGLLKLLIELARKHALPDSLRFVAVGGAPAGASLIETAMSCGVPVYQGYGLSEAGSVVAVNTSTANRPGSVGKPLPHVQVTISAAGEILVRGPTFSGYLGDAGRDSNDVLASGDCGYLDDDGYLYVTGRLRERIITPFGRNVSPEWVEAALLAQASIMQAAVFQDPHDALVAVLTPAPATAVADIAAAVSIANASLPDYARVSDWRLADAPFSQAAGELSAGGAPRRDVIETRYSASFHDQPSVINE